MHESTFCTYHECIRLTADHTFEHLASARYAVTHQSGTNWHFYKWQNFKNCISSRIKHFWLLSHSFKFGKRDCFFPFRNFIFIHVGEEYIWRYNFRNFDISSFIESNFTTCSGIFSQDKLLDWNEIAADLFIDIRIINRSQPDWPHSSVSNKERRNTTSQISVILQLVFGDNAKYEQQNRSCQIMCPPF